MFRSFRSSRPLTFIALLAVAATASAFDSNYGPFPPDRQPRPFALTACVEWKRVDPVEKDDRFEWIGGLPGDPERKDIHVRLFEADDGNLSLEVRDGADRIVAGPQAVSDAGFWEAMTADLNRDGRPDFVIVSNYHGCGLAAWNRTVAFAISRDEEYEISSIFTMFRDDCDLLDLNHDGKCELIHVCVLSSHEDDERDARSHSYWVFHLLEVKDGRWVVTSRDTRFPKWVWYTLKPNQKATQRLTDDAKTHIWSEAGGDQQIYWKLTEKEAKEAAQP